MQVSLEEFAEKILETQAMNLPDESDRYDLFGKFDPYDKIPRALLHSGHLASYVIATGMIEPFDASALTKPATYLVSLRGPVRYLDSNGKEHRFFLSKTSVAGETDVRPTVTLEPNSLCYVTLAPKFRMPGYIAGRFNLLIRDVYRGLLVGTGPLVDPGFVGNLSIPLHNLTSNKYVLHADEGFVYFEFTKLSGSVPFPQDLPPWVPPVIETWPPFPSNKNSRKSLDDYIAQATGSGPAQSSLRKDLKSIKKLSKTAKRRIAIYSLVGAVSIAALVITGIAAYISALQVYQGAQQFTQGARTDTLSSIEKLNERLSQLKEDMDQIKQRNRELEQRYLHRKDRNIFNRSKKPNANSGSILSEM